MFVGRTEIKGAPSKVHVVAFHEVVQDVVSERSICIGFSILFVVEVFVNSEVADCETVQPCNSMVEENGVVVAV